MKDSMKDSKSRHREDYIEQLVDLFYRCNKSVSKKKIMFQDLTSYLIEHEVE